MTSAFFSLRPPLHLPFWVRVFLSIASVGASLLLFGALSRAIFSTRLELEQIKTDIALLEQRQRTAFSFAQMSKNRKTDIERIQGLFVDPERPLDFIESLETMARRADTRIALGVESSGNPDTLAFRITIEGSEKNVRAMHKLLETAPYAIEQERVTFQRIEEQKGASPSPAPSSRLVINFHVSTL